MKFRSAALAISTALGLVAAVPPAHAATGSHVAGSHRAIRAVVLLSPGLQAPAQFAGVQVLTALPHVGAEIVRATPAALAALATDPRVAGVSPDRAGRVSGDDKQSAAGNSVLAAKALGGDAGHPDTGKGINVALLDTGVTDTPALNRASGRITDGVDVSALSSGGDARTSGTFTDGYGHGTFLASLIAGGKVPGSGGRAIGVAPAARIVVVKVADANGNTSLSQVLAGMDWVAAHARAIDVVNLALAVDRPTAPAYGADPLTAAVEHVRAAGVVVVAAAGNEPGQVGDPGLDPQALTVGAADVSQPGPPAVASFSGSGVVDGVAKPDIVAPGMHVLGVMPASAAIATAHPEGWTAHGLFKGSGTSEATAITSGVVAAYLAKNPGANTLQVKSALRSSAQKMKDPRAGAGLLHFDAGKGPKPSADAAGESGFDAKSFATASWQGVKDWPRLLSATWSGPAWDAVSWSGSVWDAVSWSSSAWSAVSWSAVSWSAVSWSAVSWSAVSWSAVSWSDYGWGDQ